MSLKWYLLALVLPIIPQWISLFVWAQLTGETPTLPSAGAHFSSWIQITLISAAYYITEEIGWRGFMLPRILSLYPWIKSSVITGIIWSIWHYPIWITASWATTGSITEVTGVVIASSFFATALALLITWIFNNTSGSVLLAMVLHGSSQSNLAKMYTAAGDTALLNPSFMIVQALCISSVAILLIIIVRAIDNTKHLN